MLNRLTPKDRAYLARVKACPCSVCGAPGISEAHHIRQGAAEPIGMGYGGRPPDRYSYNREVRE